MTMEGVINDGEHFTSAFTIRPGQYWRVNVDKIVTLQIVSSNNELHEKILTSNQSCQSRANASRIRMTAAV